MTRLFGRRRRPVTGFVAAATLLTLGRLVDELDLGAVHLTGQDISGVTTFRLAAVHPELVAASPRSRPACPGSDWRCSPM